MLSPLEVINLSKNYNNKIGILARGFNSDVKNNGNKTWSGYHGGVSFLKKSNNLFIFPRLVYDVYLNINITILSTIFQNFTKYPHPLLFSSS